MSTTADGLKGAAAVHVKPRQSYVSYKDHIATFMLHKVTPCVLFETPHFLFVDRLKSTHWSDSNQNYETGSHHTQITGFFPLLSRSALYFRYSALCLHTRQLKSNTRVNMTIDYHA